MAEEPEEDMESTSRLNTSQDPTLLDTLKSLQTPSHPANQRPSNQGRATRRNPKRRPHPRKRLHPRRMPRSRRSPKRKRKKTLTRT